MLNVLKIFPTKRKRIPGLRQLPRDYIDLYVLLKALEPCFQLFKHYIVVFEAGLIAPAVSSGRVDYH